MNMYSYKYVKNMGMFNRYIGLFVIIIFITFISIFPFIVYLQLFFISLLNCLISIIII
jgi:hypothetical protein